MGCLLKAITSRSTLVSLLAAVSLVAISIIAISLVAACTSTIGGSAGDARDARDARDAGDARETANCGDGICSADESCESCESDCGSCQIDCDQDCGQSCCESCEGFVAEAAQVPSERRVRVIYLAASDTSAKRRTIHALALDHALRGVQAWYGEHMGAAYQHQTFALDDTIVIGSDYPQDEWQDFGINGFLNLDSTRSDGCGMYHTVHAELNAGGKLEALGMAPIGTGDDLYFVLGGGGTNGSCGGGGLATTELETLIGAPEGTPGADSTGSDLIGRCPTGRADSCSSNCSGPGVIAHEIGHGFGLPHTIDRPEGHCSQNDSVMYEWWNYGAGTSLCPNERADLAASGFFAVPTN